jgi:hypothetical protein
MFSGDLNLGLAWCLEFSEDTVEVRDRRPLSVKADNQFSERKFAFGENRYRLGGSAVQASTK